MTDYRPDTPILSLAPWLADPVTPAAFPECTLRHRAEGPAAQIGLDGLSDDEWLAHFCRFEPLADNLPEPLALKYHGHQFRVYNADLGDGRGFLFAQMRDEGGRLLDLGTKGSGQTPYSRAGDGRLTLQGAVRELLATEMLGALGVDTSRTFSIVETGEQLERHDEPSPTRSAVLTRLSHGHIRIGTFQRLLAHDEPDQMRELVAYCLEQFPGPLPPADAPEREEPAVILMHQVVERLADLAASYIVAGFVHGVLNTDNMNISGESFDYGPWRFLPEWNGGFTAAYFDHAGLYAFARQPEAIHWNCGQLGVALRLLVEAPPLIAALERFGALYQQAVGRRWCWRLGLVPGSDEENAALVAASEQAMRDAEIGPDTFFYRHRSGRAAEGALAEALAPFEAVAGEAEYWEREIEGASHPASLVHSEVERIWSAIAQDDDWSPLHDKLASIRDLGNALGPRPLAKGHLASDSDP
ncbi:YdiU family protein [Altererythrobacter aurantiacus]|uniref:YdiU family protein n=1 Tax=Parapontixanthobacter aurantiacus TaxID=1463599 RepID=A0A844ZGP6_9SPHN|nr:YdiU family protein [Parapontixanthobacter aurantiacus]MXO84889.1 YdiU family protein [Parapontixanthobacter aurantiacus]